MGRLNIILALMFGCAAAAHAQTTFVWTGTGTDNNFETGSNWQGGVAPTGSPTDNWVFTASAQQQPLLNSALVVDNVTFSTVRNGFWLDAGTGTPSITIYGDVTTNVGSSYWGIFNLPVILSSGNHTYTTPAGSADLYHFGTLGGSGGITKNGPGSLFLAPYGGPNTYTGGTVINGGTLYVSEDSSLGTGAVTFNSGSIGVLYGNPGTLTLANDFQLGGNVSFGSDYLGQPAINLAGNITPVSGVTYVAINQTGPTPLTISGNIGEGAGATTYAFRGSGNNTGFFLSGTNTYTGGTQISDAWVRFTTAASVPTTGMIQSNSAGYAGLADPTGTTAFLGQIDPVNFFGTVGFDSPVPATPQVFAADINLSRLNASVSLGTTTSAIFYGAITPPSGASGYNFQGTGQLYLQDPLSSSTAPLAGDLSLNVTTIAGALDPLVLVLSRAQANTYTGGTYVNGAGVVFDSPGALPAEGSLHLTQPGSYIGYTDAAGLSDPSTIITQINNGSHDPGSILGFDSHTAINHLGTSPVVIDSLNLGNLYGSIYVGTASQATFTGNITTSSDGSDDYYFAGYDGGTLRVSAYLTGSQQVHVGVPVTVNPANLPTVIIDGATNDYTGGTELITGRLLLGNNGALGTGALTVDNNYGPAYLGTSVTGTTTLLNPINLNGEDLHLQPATEGALVLGGPITGYGSLVVEYPNVTLSGNNSFSGGTVVHNAITLTADSNTALGTGSVDLEDSSALTFTPNALAPVIGSLLNNNGTPSINLADNAVLTVNQTIDETFSGQFLGNNIALVKTGPNSLWLSGDNSALVSTTITAGKVIAGSPTSLGATVVLNGGTLGVATGVTFSAPISFTASGGTLSGNGTFYNPITAGTNVTLSPGDSPGTLTFASGLTLAPGGSLVFQVQAAGGVAGTDYDLLSVSGALLNVTATSGAPFTIYLTSLDATGAAGAVSDFSPSTSYTWTFATSALGVSGFASNKFVLDTSAFTNGTAGGTFSLAESGNDLVINFTPVPEPSTYALLALGLAGSAITAYRRRRA